VATTYHNPEDKIEALLKAYVAAQITGEPGIVTTMDSAEAVNPRIEVECLSCKPPFRKGAAKMDGNWLATVALRYISRYDPTAASTAKTNHLAGAVALSDCILSSSIVADLNTQAGTSTIGITVLEVYIGERSRGINGSDFVTEQQIEAHIYPHRAA